MEALTSPMDNPGHLKFLKIVVQIPPLRATKPSKCQIVRTSILADQMPPSPGKIKSVHIIFLTMW